MDLGKVGKVAKAVETAAPKLEDVAKDAMAWVTQADKRTKAHETYFSKIEDLRNEIADVEDNINNGLNNYSDYEKLRGMYRSDISKMAKNLEIPKTLKTHMIEELYGIDYASPGEGDFGIHNVLSKYHNRIAKLPPNEKNLFDTVVNQYTPKKGEYTPIENSFNFASGALIHLRKLNPTQQDTFLKMLPEWEQSLDDLEVVARTI